LLFLGFVCGGGFLYFRPRRYSRAAELISWLRDLCSRSCAYSSALYSYVSVRGAGFGSSGLFPGPRSLRLSFARYSGHPIVIFQLRRDSPARWAYFSLKMPSAGMAAPAEICGCSATEPWRIDRRGIPRASAQLGTWLASAQHPGATTGFPAQRNFPRAGHMRYRAKMTPT